MKSFSTILMMLCTSDAERPGRRPLLSFETVWDSQNVNTQKLFSMCNYELVHIKRENLKKIKGLFMLIIQKNVD